MRKAGQVAIFGILVCVTAAGCGGGPDLSTPPPSAAATSLVPSASAATPTPPSPTRAVESPAPREASKATVIVDAPQMVFSRAEDQLHAPETLVIDGDTLTIADRVHKLLVTFRSGRRTGTLAFPDMKIQDMAIRDNRYYFLDPDQMHVAEYVLEADNELHRSAVWELPAAACLIRWDGPYLVALLVENNQWVSVTGSDPITPNPKYGIEGRSFQIFDGPLTILIPARWEPIGIELIDREGGYSYYKVTDNYTRADASQAYRSYIYQFDNEGRFIHSYTLREAKEHKPAREIQIYDGLVYQLYETKATVQILRLTPNP